MSRYAVVMGSDLEAFEASGGTVGSALALFADREDAEDYEIDHAHDYDSGVAIVEVDDDTLIAVDDGSEPAAQQSDPDADTFADREADVLRARDRDE